MPIRTGSRLERLQQLQRQIRHARDSAQRRGDNHEAGRLDALEVKLTAAIKTENRRLHGNSVDKQMKDAGIDARTVRTWALAEGLTTATRGRLGAELVEAYITNHQETA